MSTTDDPVTTNPVVDMDNPAVLAALALGRDLRCLARSSTADSSLPPGPVHGVIVGCRDDGDGLWLSLRPPDAQPTVSVLASSITAAELSGPDLARDLQVRALIIANEWMDNIVEYTFSCATDPHQPLGEVINCVDDNGDRVFIDLVTVKVTGFGLHDGEIRVRAESTPHCRDVGHLGPRVDILGGPIDEVIRPYCRRRGPFEFPFDGVQSWTVLDPEQLEA